MKLWTTVSPISRRWHCSQHRWSDARPAEWLRAGNASGFSESTVVVYYTPKTRVKFAIDSRSMVKSWVGKWTTGWTRRTPNGRTLANNHAQHYFHSLLHGYPSPNHYALPSTPPLPPYIIRRMLQKRIAKKIVLIKTNDNSATHNVRPLLVSPSPLPFTVGRRHCVRRIIMSTLCVIKIIKSIMFFFFFFKCSILWHYTFLIGLIVLLENHYFFPRPLRTAHFVFIL